VRREGEAPVKRRHFFLILAIVLALPSLLSSQIAAPAWAKLSPPSSTPGTFDAVMGYHTATNQQVLYSGTPASALTGSVFAWGDNTYGQLGNGTLTSSRTPVQAGNLSGVMAIAGGFAHSLALKSDGTAWAWGWNNYG
jgi:hypothetical protein